VQSGSGGRGGGHEINGSIQKKKMKFRKKENRRRPVGTGPVNTSRVTEKEKNPTPSGPWQDGMRLVNALWGVEKLLMRVWSKGRGADRNVIQRKMHGWSPKKKDEGSGVTGGNEVGKQPDTGARGGS